MKNLAKVFFIIGVLVSQISLASVYNNKATVILKAGTETRYFAAAKYFNVVRETRKEPGNLAYDLVVDKLNSRVVIFNEKWKTKADLDKHLGLPHMAAFFKSINFDPALYDIIAVGNKVTFTPKANFTRYVIESLTLEGEESFH